MHTFLNIQGNWLYSAAQLMVKVKTAQIRQNALLQQQASRSKDE